MPLGFRWELALETFPITTLLYRYKLDLSSYFWKIQANNLLCRPRFNKFISFPLSCSHFIFVFGKSQVHSTERKSSFFIIKAENNIKIWHCTSEMDFISKNTSALPWYTVSIWPPSEFSLTTPCILSEIPSPCSYSIALTVNVLLGWECQMSYWAERYKVQPGMLPW